MRGDVLLYHDKNLVSKLIQWHTHGPYNHVAVDLGDGFIIEATSWGIVRSPIGGYAVRVFVPPSSTKNEALLWLKSQIGSPYGWADIASTILPSWLPIHLILGEPHAYDCSDLVARYLDLAGVLPLAELGGNAETVTPNDLWRAFKRKGWLL